MGKVKHETVDKHSPKGEEANASVKTGETDWRHASGVRETTPEESGI